MASPQPSSPPSRRRQSSQNFDSLPQHSRRSSQTSTFSHRRTASHASDLPVSPSNANGELGDSLADELANAWDDDNDDTFYTEATEVSNPDPQTPQPSSPVNNVKDQETPATVTKAESSPNKRNGTPKTPSARHARNRSLYDGDGYPALDQEYSSQAAEFPRELEQTIRDIEKLALQGRSQSDMAKKDAKPDVVATLLSRLENLGNQSTLETHAGRLITAHSSVTTQLGFQARALQSFTYPLLSPLSLPPSMETIEELLPLLIETISMIPQPSHTAFNSMAHLSTSSQEAVSSLSVLSDSLHMCRQVETNAGRRLKSAREGVSEMGREYEAADVGQAYIQQGNWDRKLQNREAAKACEDIVSGFEQKCGQMRERLAASAAAAG